MKAVILGINLAVLRDILELPKNIKLARVRQSWEQEQMEIFEILVEGDDLPEVKEGHPFPFAVCELERNFCEAGNHHYIKKGALII